MSHGWNLLMYVIPDNGDEHADALRTVEAMRAAPVPKSCKITVQIMYGHKSARYEIPDGNPKGEGIENLHIGCQEDLLAEFIGHAKSKSEGNRTALIIQAHTSRLNNVYDCTGMARDKQTALTCVAMKNAIESAAGRVDLLGLNSCWMAALEIEYELRGIAEVLVASQVYARPWPYREIVESLSRAPDQPADALALAIVSAVDSAIKQGDPGRKDAVSAFLAGGRMQDLADAFGRYADRVSQLIDNQWSEVRDAVLTRAQRIDDPHQVDLVSLTGVLGNGDPEARRLGEDVRVCLKSTRLGHTAHSMHPGIDGLSIFCPKSLDVNLANAYVGIDFSQYSWGAFLAAFRDRLQREHQAAIAATAQVPGAGVTS